MLDLADRIQAVPNNRGAGFFYWEPLWYNGNVSWATQAGMNYLSVQSTMGNEWDNQAMFDLLETPCQACVRLNKQGRK